MNRLRHNQISSAGYTIAELVIVILVMAALSGVAFVRFSRTTSGSIASAAHCILSDVSYAQELAKINNAGSEVTFISSVLPPRGRCFVATACYSAEAAPVEALRQFRDQRLEKTEWGRRFIAWYYRYGPGLADLVNQVGPLKLAARAVLLPIALLTIPFTEDAYGLGRIAGREGGVRVGHWRKLYQDGGLGQPNSYSLKYQNGTMIKDPSDGLDYIVYLSEDVTITTPSRTIRFDGAGRMSIPGYAWSSSQTSMNVCSLNSTVNIYIARHSGKMWIQ
ncbi:MAG: CFI-box-CTERM domain-containing protein [Calditrichota bacterium]